MRAAVALGLSLLALASLHAAAPPTPRDPLPDGALARLGYARLALGYPLRLHVSPDSRYVVSYSNWCDLVEGGAVPPPIHIPEGYTLTRFLRGGYVVENRGDYLLFDPGKRTPRASFEASEAKIDGVGRYSVSIEEVGKKTALKLADLRTPDEGRTWLTITTLDRKPSRVVLSDDGGQVAWLEDDNKRIGVYHIATQKEVAIVPGEGEGVLDFALSPDGKHIAALSTGIIAFHDTTTGKRVRRAERPLISSSDLMFTPDGKLVVLTSNTEGLVIVPIDAAKPAYRLALTGGRQHLRHACLSDSLRIAVAEAGGVIRVYDLRSGKQVDGHSRYPSFDGVQLLDDHTAASWTRQGLVVCWDTRTGRILSEKTLPVPKSWDFFQRMTFSPDGRHVVASVGATEMRDKQLVLLADLTTGKILSQHTSNGYSRFIAAFQPSGQSVAILGNYDGRTKGNFTMLEIPSARRLWAREQVHGVFTFTRDGRNVLHAYQYGISLIEEASGKTRWSTSLATLERNRDNTARLVAVDPRGHRAVVVRDRDVGVHDGLTGEPIVHVLLGEAAEEGRRAAISGNTRYLATVNYGSDLRIFDLMAKVHSEPILQRYLPGTEVRQMALNADGSRLITAHENGTCLVWDVKALMTKPDAPSPHVPEWDRLALLDAEQAQPAIVALCRDGKRAVTLLAKKLTPAVAIAPKRIAAWIDDLDSDDFARRTTAEASLLAAHDQAEEALRGVLKKPASLEQARRAERLLKRIENRENDTERLRQVRAVEILERIGTKEAIALLKTLAAGAPGASLTREASASLERLQR